MFPPFDPERDDRKRRQRVFARGQVPIRVLIPNIFTACWIVRRVDRDPYGYRTPVGFCGRRACLRGFSGWHRRPCCAASESLFALRRRARQPCGLCEFRCGAGDHHVRLVLGRFAQPRLDCGVGFCGLFGVTARPLQCVARPARPARLAECVLRGRTGAGGCHHPVATDLCPGSGASLAEPDTSGAGLYACYRPCSWFRTCRRFP